MSIATLPVAKPLIFPEDSLYEVVDGQVVEKTVSTYAALLAMRLLFSLKRQLDSDGLGMAVIETMFLLDPETNLRRRPDVAFISSRNWPLEQIPPLEGDWLVVPDIAVEVLSPHDLYHQVNRKLEEYLRHGVREVWLISPEARCVEVFRDSTSRSRFDVGDAVETTLIPGWSMDVAELIPLPAATLNSEPNRE